MSKYFFNAAILSLILLAGSCAPIYQCGETAPENGVRGGKRLKAVVSERDSLCSTLADEEALTEQLENSLANKTEEHLQLQEEFRQLEKESSLTSDELSAEIQQKSRELEQKERLLSEREEALREMQEVIARQDSITNRLQKVLRDALLDFDSDELSVEIKNGKVYVSMSDKLLFKSGSATVEAKGEEALEALANVLEKNQDISIMVEGHTDNVPIKTSKYKDNWDLSVARATSIVRILAQNHNIDPLRMTASGKGEFMPKASNETAEGKATNRRTEIILSPKLDELINLLQN